MNRIDVGIAVSYGILGGLVVLVVGVAVAFSTLGGRAIDAERLGHHERTWFGIVMVALVALLFGTIFFTPYGRSDSSAPQTSTRASPSSTRAARSSSKPRSCRARRRTSSSARTRAASRSAGC